MTEHNSQKLVSCPYKEVGCDVAVEADKLDAHLFEKNDKHNILLLHSILDFYKEYLSNVSAFETESLVFQNECKDLKQMVEKDCNKYNKKNNFYDSDKNSFSISSDEFYGNNFINKKRSKEFPDKEKQSLQEQQILEEKRKKIIDHLIETVPNFE